MSVSIDDLPLEIIALILSDLDRASLLSVVRTARTLRPHAERLLYRNIDLRRSSQRGAIAFLNTVIRNPRLGSLVYSFCPDAHYLRRQLKKFNDLIPDAVKSFPNLKTFVIGRQDDFHPEWLKMSSSQVTPFHLQHLSLHLPLGHTSSWDVVKFLLQVLQLQPSLLHIAVSLEDDDGWGSCISESGVTDALEMICPSLNTLEGTNAIIRLLLPKGHIKTLRWKCARQGLEPLRPVTDLETDSRLRDTFFTPRLCEAYGRLEHLTLSNQISLLPILSPYLSSLKTLELITIMIIDNPRPYPKHWDEALFLGAIGGMKHLEVLEVTWVGAALPRHDIDPKVIFATCRNLKRFAIKKRSTAGTVYTADCMQRGTDGSAHYVAQV